MKRKKSSKADDQNIDLFAPKPEKPDFLELIKNPMLERTLPDDFSPEIEAAHLDDLWKRIPHFGKYKFVGFVDAGRSSIVFKVLDDGDAAWAMTIVRQKIYAPVTEADKKAALTPATERELWELQEELSHPHPVGFQRAIQDIKGIVAIISVRPPPSGKLEIP
jgi:hypothetical protein